jgi:alpha-beta hydrolase superfamily lysophospholipase
MIEYARAFARAGLVALVCDHRNLGHSGGEARGEINPWVQCRGYIAALDFAVRRDEIDPDLVALWGDSYTGGQVIAVAGCDSRPRAVVAQCPVFGAALPARGPDPDFLAVFRQTLLDGDVAGTPETTTGSLPVVSFDPLSIPSLLAPIQAFRWFIDCGGRPGSVWVNPGSRVLPPTPVPYAPIHCAPFVAVPVLLMVAPADEMAHANVEVTRHAYELLAGPKRWVNIEDGHFGLPYHPGARFDVAAGIQAAFLRQQLLN